ncbi:hypothetical protein [Clostridium botulinum]|uniref:hypothetical protein n=1 Tax=Clostridium botulinum TaxID=1491 RepID=UPI0007745257|nr:hypothetical protein [Clostridium botulinum]APH20801.1 hypothetical protein NPD1_4120 [Clostridium botulinum]APQ71222.1 hypothetical protein RSJ8_4077 [Clostridium botulinum]MBN3379068.1 hypothetical protein [Clostridium botulinum]
MSEKAKYIENKEITLFNDLDKSYKKLKEIANWYSLSNYKSNFQDERNQKLYIQKINNVYHEMKSLIISSKNIKILNDYERLIIEDKLNSLAELEEALLDIGNEKNKLSEDEYSLNAYEAIDLCLNENELIVGQDFQKGFYAKNLNGTIVLMTINNGFSHEVVDNLMLTKGLLNQKFKTLVCANPKTLGLKNN